MGSQPNQKQLLIPGKTKASQAQPEYGTDMRAIETWAAAGGGSQGAQGAQGAQGSSGGGGGGGGGFEFITLNFTPDANSTDVETVFISGTPPNNQGSQTYPLFSNTSGGTQTYSVAAAWEIFASAGESVVILPGVSMPAFTGGPVSIFLSMFAMSTDGLNYATWQSNVATPASSTNFQFAASDFTDQGSYGSDLTMTAGTGFSGNGLVSAGYTVPYIGSVSGIITVPTGTSFGGGGGGGGYASLTGPGQSTTPGDLTQAGGFTINEGGATGIALNSTGTGNIDVSANAAVDISAGGSGGLNLSQVADGNMAIEVTSGAATGSLLIENNATSSGPIQISNSHGTIVIKQSNTEIEITGGTINIYPPASALGSPVLNLGQSNAMTLAFFGVAGDTQQASAGITTVAQLVTVLKNYGLLS